MKLSFLGLGIMGSAMASHLLKKGYNLEIWNRTPEKTTKNGFKVLSLQEVIRDSDIIIMCLGDDDSVKMVVSQIIGFGKKNCIIIDHTTTSASLSKELYYLCKKRGISFMDAPITGGQTGAINGTLVIMCGGDKNTFEKSKDVLTTYSSKLEYFGGSGRGQECKMVNQVAIAGIIQSLSEAIIFAQKMNIDINKLISIISEGAAGSWQMKNRSNLMISRNYQENFGFPVEWMVKDLNICLEHARSLGLNLENTEDILKNFNRVKKEINSRFDTSSLVLLRDPVLR